MRNLETETITTAGFFGATHREPARMIVVAALFRIYQ